ncbi:glycosyltransferase [Mucilaginibacter angelicae]|uniref:Glycosyltransferase n=1 Tax=Mucilaginibacter angelicae TaxID=869718 RepID=A0ABV6L516_9SPHI
MNRNVLIISPYFPPVNAADMQRVRMSLPYFRAFGWDAEVVAVDPLYTDMGTDALLSESVPPEIRVHTVKAFPKSFTSRFGLGSIALRSLWFYRQLVNSLLIKKKYDLIYFSTTQFPVCILGAYWKKKFGVPYVVDMQDPWHSGYYRDKPRDQRPPKYWFSYRLNKYLERPAIRHADGLISVSDNYIEDLKARYPSIRDVPSATITFGAFDPDMQIAAAHNAGFSNILDPSCTNIVYIGRGGADLHKAIAPLFRAIGAGSGNLPRLKPFRCYFIGTSYAPAGQGSPSILPLARQFGIAEQVTELTDRIGFYHSLATLQRADALFIAGSDDPRYTASKIFPYTLAAKPLLGIFNPASSAIRILKEYGAVHVYDYESVEAQQIDAFLSGLRDDSKRSPQYEPQAIAKYSAQQMTARQCSLFDKVLQEI